MHTIINVGRSFGSGGGYVAKAVGARLGIPVYDNELISKVAEEKGYSKSLFAKGEEKKSLFSLSSFFASGRPSYAEGGLYEGSYLNDTVLFNIQSEVIRGIAAQGDAIIVGRCADYILRDEACLNVFICAPEAFRIKRLMENEGLGEEEARRLMQRKDRTRETYYNYYTFGAWGQAANYHLCVDSSILGIEGTAGYIIDFGRKAGLIR